MAKDTPPSAPADNTALVLFGGQLPASIPAAVRAAMEKHGLKAEERPGYEPIWKPDVAGASLLGRVSSVREGAGKFGGTIVTLATTDGYRSVWLSADLKIKLLDGASLRGRLFMIEYLGKESLGAGKNEMRRYRVTELLA